MGVRLRRGRITSHDLSKSEPAASFTGLRRWPLGIRTQQVPDAVAATAAAVVRLLLVAEDLWKALEETWEELRGDGEQKRHRGWRRGRQRR